MATIFYETVVAQKWVFREGRDLFLYPRKFHWLVEGVMLETVK